MLLDKLGMSCIILTITKIHTHFSIAKVIYKLKSLENKQTF